MLKTLARRVLGPSYVPLTHAYISYVENAHRRPLSSRPAVFDDRRKGRSTLLMILSGHKAELWPLTMERVARCTPAEAADVCIVCSGGAPHGAQARELAGARGWSFLQAEEDLLAHVQNLAVREFGDASSIVKIDEDMFVTPGWLEALESTAEAVEREAKFRVGIVAPVTPVNGFGYRLFLELTGKLDEYRAAFPQYPPTSAAMDVGAHLSPEVAEWLWRQTSPLDERARELSRLAGEYSVCPHRFSIGAFLMRRSTFDEFGGFAVAPRPGQLGYEEARLCASCVESSRVIVVAHASLVGHFAFGPQWAHMAELLKREPALFQ